MAGQGELERRRRQDRGEHRQEQEGREAGARRLVRTGAGGATTGAKKKGLPREALLDSSRSGGSGRFGLIFLDALDRTAILALGVRIAIDQFDDADRSGVRSADAGLDHAGIAAIAIGVARREDVEQLLQLGVIEEARESVAAIGEAAFLGQGDQLLDLGPKLLRLGKRGGDLLVLDQGRRHVAEHRLTVA